MSAGAAGVRAFVDRLPNDALFARKQLVSDFGTRGAVDNVLQRLSSEHKIARVATGIYQKRAGASRLPSAREIIELRASVFGKQIIEPADSSSDCTTFRTDGCRSSFRSVYGRLYFKPAIKARVQHSPAYPKSSPVVLVSVATSAPRPGPPTLFGLVRRWFVRMTGCF